MDTMGSMDVTHQSPPGYSRDPSPTPHNHPFP